MKHYVPRLTSGSIGEVKALEKAMQSFRTLVVDPIDREVERLYRDEILNNFERGGVKIPTMGAAEIVDD